MTRPLKDYVGRYSNEQLGNVQITVQQNTLGLKLGNIETVSTPFTQPDTIRVEILPGQGEVIKFEFNADGQIDSLSYAGMKFVRVK